MPINIVKCGGELFLNSQTMHRSAFCLVGDLVPLWLPGARRGDNKLIPLIAGKSPRRMRYDEMTHSLDMVVVGDVDHAGTHQSDPWAGLEANLSWMFTNILGIPSYSTSPNSTISASLTMPSGATRTGLVQVVDFKKGEIVDGFDQSSTRTVGFLATLDIRIPGGQLT